MKLRVLNSAILLSFSTLQMQCVPAFGGEAASTTGLSTPATNSSEPSKAIWDEWHKSVAAELFNRIKLNVSKLCRTKEESQFHVKVLWRVCRDGNISLKEIEETNSLSVREAIRSAVDSMKFIPLVKFPSGSSREYVEKLSEFSVGLKNPVFGDFDSTTYKPHWKGNGNN